MDFSEQLLILLHERQKGNCGHCGLTFGLNPKLEQRCYYLIPKHFGGKQEEDNCVILCNECLAKIEADSKFKDPTLYSLDEFEPANFAGNIIKVYTDSFRAIAGEIEKCLVEVETATYLKDARNKLLDVKNKVNTMFLLYDQHREELNNKIQSGFDVINSRLTKSKKQYELKSQENIQRIKPEIENVIKYSKETTNFKDAREKLIRIQSEVRNTTLRKHDKDVFFKDIRNAFDELRIRQDEEREQYEMECSENFFRLKALIEHAVDFASKTEIFKNGRQKLIEAQHKIKGHVLKKDKRDELYGMIRIAFDALNERQDIERAEFDRISSENYEKVNIIVDEAVEFAKCSEIFKDAREALINAQNVIKEFPMKRVRRNELFGRIREVFNEINQRQNQERETFESECSENYNKLVEKINIAVEDAENAPDFRVLRDNLIALQDEVKILRLKREQRNGLFKKIRQAFSIFDERRNEYREVMKVEKRDKLMSIIDNLNLKTDRINESIARDREMLEEEQAKIPPDNDAEPQSTGQVPIIDKRIADKGKSIEEINKRIADIKNELEKLK